MVGVTGLGHKSKYLYVALLLELLGLRPLLLRFAQSELFSSCHNRKLVTTPQGGDTYLSGRGDRTRTCDLTVPNRAL